MNWNLVVAGAFFVFALFFACGYILGTFETPHE